MKVLQVIGRDQESFSSDIKSLSVQLNNRIAKSKFLVIGRAGSIGQAVTRETFKREPKVLPVVNTSENNMVELVLDLRCTAGYGSSEFKIFAVDCGSGELERL